MTTARERARAFVKKLKTLPDSCPVVPDDVIIEVELEELIAAAVVAEREECAKVADSARPGAPEPWPQWDMHRSAADNIAAAIRARPKP